MGYYKGFLALVLLCSIANAQKYLNPKEEYEVADGSIYDRFVNLTATEKEKEGVMGAIKEIISNAPNSTNWKQLVEVIRVGKLEENIEKLGGEKSRKVVKNLQLLYRNTENISALTAYMHACLEFMSIESLSREEKMYLFAELLGPKRYQTWYKANPKVRKAMGLEKVYEFPKEQIDFLVNYWNETPILKEGVLLKKIQLVENTSASFYKLGSLVLELTEVLKSFKNSVFYSLIGFTGDAYIIFYDGLVFELLSDPKILDFNFSVVKSIEKELAEHPEYETSLVNHLAGKGPVSEYFAHPRLNSGIRFNALKIYEPFVNEVKNSTQQQLNALTTFIKKYIWLGRSLQETIEEVMLTSVTREKCWKIWEKQSYSKEAVEMVELVNLLDEEFGIKTCLANVIELKNTVKISKYWNQHLALGNLTTFFPINQKFKETLRTMLADTKDLTRTSFQHMLKSLRLFVHDNPKFVEFFTTIQQLHDINLEPVWMMMKQFSQLSDDSKNKYIVINFGDGSLKNLGDFFKAIQNISNVEKDFEGTFLKPKEQWTEDNMEDLLELLEILEKTKYSDEVDHAFDENVLEEECKKIMYSGSKNQLFRLIHYLVRSLSSHHEDLACLKFHYLPMVIIPDD